MGSFSSVLIYRLGKIEVEKNKEINLFFPRSHCPHCKKQISLINLIPLIGFIKQRGKCKNCEESISLMYPFNELLHLLVGILVIYFFEISLISLIIYTIFFVLYVLFILDLKFFYLPIGLNIFLGILGVTTNSVFDGFINDIDVLNLGSASLSILGYSAGFLSLWTVNFIYRLITKKDGIGGGDFILFAGLGSIAGPLALAPILFLGSISALLIVITDLKKYSKEVPLGSGLILGFLFYVLLKYFELLENLIVI